jgi:hypothetical protein
MDQQTTTKGRKPSHRLYMVSGEGDQASWTAIGAAWQTRAREGFTLIYDAIPLQGRIVMLPVKEKVRATGDAQ